MEKNKTGKYLKYAVGEILLVVIGILIALQINNWNEGKKTKLEENKMLTQLKISLKKDLKYMQIVRHNNNINTRHVLFIKEQLQLDRSTNDSLEYYYGYLFFYNTAGITTGPYETLKSKGLDLISNDSLRNATVDYYEETVKYYIDKDYYLSRNFILEYCTKLFNTVAFWSEETGNIGKVIPNDFESLKKDKIFLNLVNTKIGEMDFQKDNLEMAEEEVQNLINIIDNELKSN